MLLETLEMQDLVVNVIDRNAAFIQTLNDLPVVTLDECKFVDNAVVIIASLSFVDDIISQFLTSELQVIRLDKL